MNFHINTFWTFIAVFISTTICLFLVIAGLLVLDDNGTLPVIPKISQFESDYVSVLKFLTPFLLGSLISILFIFYIRLRLAPRPLSLSFILAVLIPALIAVAVGLVFIFMTLGLRGGL